MRRWQIGIAALLGAAVFAGCGGGGTHTASLPRVSSVGRTPDGSATFIIHFPSDIVRAHSAARAARFVDPYGTPMLYVSTTETYTGASSTVCFTVSPQPDGTEQVTIPVYSNGGTVTIREYQGGNPATCSILGQLLAQSWNGGLYGYGYGNSAVPYNGFTPGTNVYAFEPTPTPSPNPSASPTVATGGPIFTQPLTLQPVVSKIIYESASAASYGFVSLPNSSTTTLPSTGAGSVNVCAGDTITFLAADYNGVSLGGNTLPTPSPNPSGSPTPAPLPTPVAYSGFLPVAFSQFFVTSGSARPGSSPGTISVGTSTSASFTVTANDVFGTSVTDTVVLGPGAC